MYTSRGAERHWVKRTIFLFTALVLLFPLASVIYLSGQRYVVAAETQTLSIAKPEQVQIPWPEHGTAAIGAVGYGLLDSSGQPDQAVPIASITKLITALAVLDKKPIATDSQGETLTFSAADTALYNDYRARGGAGIPIASGQQLTEYQALEAMLIPSANNLADSLAIWVFGSMEAYLDYANQMAQRHGLKDTLIADASGFSPGTVSSARDLVRLAEIVAEKPILNQIVSKPSSTLPEIGSIYSTNKLLGIDGIIGIKTGNTDEAGDCLLSLAEHTLASGEKIKIIVLVLGQPDRNLTFAHTQSILAAAKGGFVSTKVVSAGQPVGQVHSPWGAEATVQADESISVVRWRESELAIQTSIPDVTAPKSAGEGIGAVVVQAGDNLYETTASLDSPISEPSVWWRFKNLFN